jgi:hypothetical protein
MLQREIMLQQKQLAEGGQPINGGKKKTGKAGTPKATGSDPSVDSVVPGAGIKAVLDANTTGT